MTSDLLLQLEQKVAHAVEIIELLNLQVEELEQENRVLKAEHQKWRNDLASLIKRFDRIDAPSAPIQRARIQIPQHAAVQEEDFMTV